MTRKFERELAEAKHLKEKLEAIRREEDLKDGKPGGGLDDDLKPLWKAIAEDLKHQLDEQKKVSTVSAISRISCHSAQPF